MKRAKQKYPIEHWSYSSLIAYLRNPLAWHKRYVEHVYDLPSTPASAVGRAAHKALEYFYGGLPKEAAIDLGLEYLKDIPDFELSFGKAVSRNAKKKKRREMESDYLRVIGFYLERPPKHKVLGVEVKTLAQIPGIDIPIKAVSDLVVVSRTDPQAVDIVDHKFVDSYGKYGSSNPLFMVQALFNYYTVIAQFGRPVQKFIVYECKKTKNRDGRPQLRKHTIDFKEREGEFALFHRLVADATRDILTRKTFLPNPSDMFDGEASLNIYRWGLADDEVAQKKSS